MQDLYHQPWDPLVLPTLPERADIFRSEVLESMISRPALSISFALAPEKLVTARDLGSIEMLYRALVYQVLFYGDLVRLMDSKLTAPNSNALSFNLRPPIRNSEGGLACGLGTPHFLAQAFPYLFWHKLPVNSALGLNMLRPYKRMRTYTQAGIIAR